MVTNAQTPCSLLAAHFASSTYTGRLALTFAHFLFLFMALLIPLFFLSFFFFLEAKRNRERKKKKHYDDVIIPSTAIFFLPLIHVSIFSK